MTNPEIRFIRSMTLSLGSLIMQAGNLLPYINRLKQFDSTRKDKYIRLAEILNNAQKELQNIEAEFMDEGIEIDEVSA